MRIYDFINLYGGEIGDESQIGPFVEAQGGLLIGKRVKVQSHSFICEGATIEGEAVIGHGVMFINDKYPVATLPDGLLPPERERARVGLRAAIGSNATLLGNVAIGERSLIGAGSVVTDDVPAKAVMAGAIQLGEYKHYRQ